MAYPVFDLVSEGPAERVTTRRAVRDLAPFGPAFVRQADHRKLRTYEIAIRTGRPTERLRLHSLWSQTRIGTTPMVLPHADDGNVNVVFDEPELLYRQLTSRATAIRVRLREVLGA